MPPVRTLQILILAHSYVAVLVSTILPILVSSFATTRRRLPTPPTLRQQHYQFLLASNLKEPDESESKFGRMSYWDESYRREEKLKTDQGGSGDEDENVFSWYCGWTEEMGPFFEELVPNKEAMILVPGIGNDVSIRDMFDVGGYHTIAAFDYAPEGVECAKAIFGEKRLKTIAEKIDALSTVSDGENKEKNIDEVFRVCDARDLSDDYRDNTFDAVLEKGVLDSIYLSGGKKKNKRQENLGMAVSEMKRVLKEDGIIFSVTAACESAIREAFEKDKDWTQVRDGEFHMTEDGYTSNNVDATMLAWKLIATKD